MATERSVLNEIGKLDAKYKDMRVALADSQGYKVAHQRILYLYSALKKYNKNKSREWKRKHRAWMRKWGKK